RNTACRNYGSFLGAVPGLEAGGPARLAQLGGASPPKGRGASFRRLEIGWSSTTDKNYPYQTSFPHPTPAPRGPEHPQGPKNITERPQKGRQNADPERSCASKA